jgi:hypothetical protein
MITFQCRECGRNNAYHSRKRSTFERCLLPLFLLRPARCEHCFCRQYVTVLCEVQERPQHPDRSQSRRRVAA